MKVLLINGSPHRNGCTFTALTEVANELNKQEVETEIFQLGTESLHGCTGCGACGKLGKCVFDDVVNEAAQKLSESDGLIVGSPVHYASPAGVLISFMDRLFYSCKKVAFKPAAAVVSARRAGTTASLDVITKYFSISQMPIVSSSYWTMVHGSTSSDVEKDLEGLQIMRQLGRNMAWLLKTIKAGKDSGLELPQIEAKIKTNFIQS